VVGSYRNYTDIDGKIENGVYHDPYGRFTIKVPDLVEPGARINGRSDPHAATLQFLDDLGTLIRVDVFTAVDPDEKEMMKSPDVRTLLEVNRMSIGQLYRQVCPQAELVHQEYIADGGTVLDYYAFKMPGGATLAEVPSGKRHDALRVSVSFAEGDSLFTVTSQYVLGMWGPQDGKAEDLAKICAKMKPELLAIRQTMSFPAAASTSDK
jgi:hypothetical protein